MLSVVLPQYRVGGLDVVCDSLAHQTFHDFELIIADAIYERRHPLIKDRLAAYDFPITHLPPTGGVALSNYSRSINDAVAHARGDVILMIADYTWFPPDCLATHAAAHARSNGRQCFMLDNHCTELPPLNPAFPGYGPNFESKEYSEAERPKFEADTHAAASTYEDDLEAGKLDEVMWSLFTEPLTDEKVKALPITRSHCKQGVALDPNWCSLKNESIPTEAFLAVNGLDEDMDGSHLYQDQEFAHRVARAGFEWTTAPGGEIYMVNPRSRFYAKRLTRPMRGGGDSNEARMAVTLAGKQWANPGRNLRAEREANLSRRTG